MNKRNYNSNPTYAFTARTVTTSTHFPGAAVGLPKNFDLVLHKLHITKAKDWQYTVCPRS